MDDNLEQRRIAKAGREDLGEGALRSIEDKKVAGRK